MHDLIVIFQNSQVIFITFVGLISLIIGSFLNVVIARLPAILQRDWRKQCYEYLEMNIPISEQPDLMQNKSSLLGLFWPRSHCPHCKTMIKAYDNIPIVSYILLRGKCRACKHHISLQYPLVEAIATLAGITVALNFGVTWQTVCGCLLSYVLIVQSGIDVKHTIIPDEITLPMIWLGLILSLFNIYVGTSTAIIGAAGGYLSLWATYWLFFWITGKEGMGYGDFKLLAMLGAWLGWQMLPFVILFSSLLGSIVGICYIIFTKKLQQHRIPFGPFLAVAGWVALIWGHAINNWYVNYTGLL